MKKNFIVLGLISVFLILSCSNDDIESGIGKFNINIDGKTLSAKYVNIPIPTQNGTFSMQYSKSSDTFKHKFYFFILFDNQNEAYLDIYTKDFPLTNTLYTSTQTGNYVDFLLILDNYDFDASRYVVSFSKFSYPGQIAGTLKVYKRNPSNIGDTLVLTGDFDFVAE